MRSEFDFNTVLVVATNLGYLIAGGFICYYVVKKKLTDYFQDIRDNLNVGGKIPKQAKLDVEILRRMEQLKEIVGADRVQIYEFHNGEHYANGRSALKFSCTYEVYRVGIEPVQTKMSSIPISCDTRFINKILDEELIKVSDIEKIKEEMPASYGMRRAAKVTSYQDLVIKNGAGEPVGFINVSWCDNRKMCSNDMELYRLAAYVEERIVGS